MVKRAQTEDSVMDWGSISFLNGDSNILLNWCSKRRPTYMGSSFPEASESEVSSMTAKYLAD